MTPMKLRKVAALRQREFIDGAGMRPDGTGSGYAYFNETTGETGVKWVNGLTNNEAEYRALKYSLVKLPIGASAEIFSDSQLLVNQFNGTWAVRDPKLQRLLARVKEIIQERDLTVTLTWVPREENLAGKLLERRGK